LSLYLSAQYSGWLHSQSQRIWAAVFKSVSLRENRCNVRTAAVLLAQDCTLLQSEVSWNSGGPLAPSFGQGQTGSPCSPVQGDGLIGLDRGSGLNLTKRRVSLSLDQWCSGLAPARPIQGSRFTRSLTEGLDKHLLPQMLVAPRDGLFGLACSLTNPFSEWRR